MDTIVADMDMNVSYEVSPLTNYVGEYRDRRRVILDAIERMPSSTPISERLATYDLEMKKLRESFVAARRAEYESKSYEGSVSHSCTSGSSGGKKDCGWKWVDSPSSDLETVPSSLRVVGTNKVTTVETSRAGLKMTVAGSGRNAGTLYITFKYKQGVIERRLNDEVAQLFDLIGRAG